MPVHVLFLLCDGVDEPLEVRIIDIMIAPFRHRVEPDISWFLHSYTVIGCGAFFLAYLIWWVNFIIRPGALFSAAYFQSIFYQVGFRSPSLFRLVIVYRMGHTCASMVPDLVSLHEARSPHPPAAPTQQSNWGRRKGA